MLTECDGLNKSGFHRPIESGTKRCGPGVGMVLLEEMYH